MPDLRITNTNVLVNRLELAILTDIATLAALFVMGEIESRELERALMIKWEDECRALMNKHRERIKREAVDA